MLTRDLILYQTTKGQIVPRLINPDDPKLLAIAEELIGIYAAGIGLRRVELEDQLTPLIMTERRGRLIKGLNKLLLDRSQFQKLSNDDLSARRDTLFRQAADILRDDPTLDCLDTYGERVLSTMVIEDRSWARDCFSDLPDREPLITFKDIGPHALLHRYNCALPQSLLFYARKVDLSFTEPRVEVCRQLFHYLKFFRLLAHIERTGDHAFHLTIDGPLSLFALTQRYALALASFFPAILQLSQWQLSAKIHVPKHRAGMLVMDESSALRSHYQAMSHIPEEVSRFKTSATHAFRPWTLSDALSILSVDAQTIIVPDFTLHSKSGAMVHIELFHRWHAGLLAKRLQMLKKNPTFPLLIGVDRSIYKTKLKSALDQSEFFKTHGFLFNGFPNAEPIRPLLEIFESPL